VRGAWRPTTGSPTVLQILRQIAEPDREHIHHRLVSMGWSTRRTVLVLYLVTLVLSVLAIATARFD
jgi:UDP-GlcNAc:undecaprenyl-phosphate GlcNAc-1-phosphate transferase